MSQTQRRGAAPINPHYFDGTAALAPAYQPRSERRQWATSPRRPPARRNARRVSLSGLVALSVALVLCMMGFSSLSQTAESARLQKSIAAMENQLLEIKRENASLEQQIATANDGEMVRNYAVNKLGMIQPNSSQIRTISLPPMPQTQVASTNEEVPSNKFGFIKAMLGLLD